LIADGSRAGPPSRNHSVSRERPKAGRSPEGEPGSLPCENGQFARIVVKCLTGARGRRRERGLAAQPSQSKATTRAGVDERAGGEASGEGSVARSEVRGHDRHVSATIGPGSSPNEDGGDAELSPIAAQQDHSVLGALQPRLDRGIRVRLAR
jgi:hypothetical protein